MFKIYRDNYIDCKQDKGMQRQSSKTVELVIAFDLRVQKVFRFIEEIIGASFQVDAPI